MMSYNDFSQGKPGFPGPTQSMSAQPQSSMAPPWQDPSLLGQTPGMLDPVSQQLAAMMQSGTLNSTLPYQIPGGMPHSTAAAPQLHNPLAAMALTLLGQLHAGNGNANSYGLPAAQPQPPSVHMLQQNFMAPAAPAMPAGAAPNPLALLLAATQAQAMSGVPPELLQQYAGLGAASLASSLPFVNPLVTDPALCHPTMPFLGTVPPPFTDMTTGSQGATPALYSDAAAGQAGSPHLSQGCGDKPSVQPTTSSHLKRDASQMSTGAPPSAKPEVEPPAKTVKRSTSEDTSSNSGCSNPGQGHVSKVSKVQPASAPPSAAPQQQRVKSSMSGGSGLDGWPAAKQASMGPPPPRITNCGRVTGSGSLAQSHSDPKTQLRGLLGEPAWSSMRSTMIKQQRTFVQQLYELHKVAHMQQLLLLEVGCDGDAEIDPVRLMPLHPKPGNMSSHQEGSLLSQPSVCAPAPIAAQHLHAAPCSTATGLSNGSRPAAGAEPTSQLLQQHLAHLVNIPGPLRSKAKSVSPDTSLASGAAGRTGGTGPGAASRLGNDKAPGELRVWPPEGVLRPQPTRLAARGVGPPQASVSVVQPAGGRCTGQEAASDKQEAQDPGAAATTTKPSARSKASQQQDPPAAPVPSTPKSTPNPSATNPTNLLEAAAVLLQSTGVTLPAPPTLPSQLTSGSSRPGTKQTGSTPPTSAGPPPLMMPPVQPGLLTAPNALMSFLPGMALHPGLAASTGVPDAVGCVARPGTVPALPCVDPHAAWFSKHYSASASDAAKGSLPSSAAGGGGTGGAVAGAVAAGPGTSPAGLVPGAPPPLAAPVQWWHNEEATFGDVAPSLVSQQQQSHMSTVKQGKKKASRANLHTTFAGEKHTAGDERWEEEEGAGGAYKASAFKVVRPRKQRSQRGSNRLGPKEDGMASDDSGASLTHDGSVMGGGSVIGGGGGGGAAGVGSSMKPPGAARNNNITVTTSHPRVDSAAMDDQHSNPSPSFGAHAEPVWLDAPVPDVSAVVKGASSASGTEPGGEDKSAAGILLSLSCGVGAHAGQPDKVLPHPPVSTARQGVHAADNDATKSSGAPPMSVSA